MEDLILPLLDEEQLPICSFRQVVKPCRLSLLVLMLAWLKEVVDVVYQELEESSNSLAEGRTSP